MAIQKNLYGDKNKQLGSPASTGTSATGMGSAPAAPKPVGPASSGQFTNVSQYTKANQGAGQRLAGAVTQRVEGDVNKAKNETSDIDSVRSAVDAEKNRIATQGAEAKTQVGVDPTKLTANQDTTQHFQNLRKSVNDFNNLENKGMTESQQAAQALSKANQQVSNLGTEAGRTSLLGQTFARPTYSSGQRQLDQLLFQIGGANQVRDAGKAFGSEIENQTGIYNTGVDAITNLLGQGRTTAKDVSTGLNAELASQSDKFAKDMTTKADELNKTRVEQNNAITKFLSQGVESLNPTEKAFVQAQLAAGNLGFDSRTYNVDAGKFKQMGSTGHSAKDVVEANDAARYSALQNLAELGGTEFATVGNRGTDSGLKGSDLNTAIQAARSAMMNRFGNETIAGQGVLDRTTTGAWGKDVLGRNTYNAADRVGETWTYDANQNALNLLNDLEANRQAQINAQAVRDTYFNNGWAANSENQQVGDHRTGFNPISVGLNTSTGQGVASGIDAPEAANTAAAKVWEQFLQRLESEGYNKTLGNLNPR